jgi:hypothetical protein
MPLLRGFRGIDLPVIGFDSYLLVSNAVTGPIRADGVAGDSSLSIDKHRR